MGGTPRLCGETSEGASPLCRRQLVNVAERARSPPASSGVCGRVTEGQRECPHSRKPALSFLWAAGMSSASLGEQRPWAPCGDLPVWPHGPSPSQLGAAPAGDTPQPASLPLTVALGVRTLQGLSHLQPRRQRVLTEGRGQPRASAPPATPAAAPSARPGSTDTLLRRQPRGSAGGLRRPAQLARP